MWTCPTCERVFKTANQWHSCVDQDVGVLFENRPDELVLAFDRLLTATADWEPNHVGAAKHSVVFTNRKAWLIVKPMRQELDLKFYYPEVLSSPLVKKASPYRKEYAHHVRIRHESQVTSQLLRLLRHGYDRGMGLAHA